MLKKLFLIGFLSFLVLVVVGGWFGYQAWLHGSTTVSIQQRQLQVVAAWQTDPVAMKQAAKGKGGVRPASISSEMNDHGVVDARSYSVSGSTLTVSYLASGCHSAAYIYDIKRVNGLTSVLIYPDAPWTPDLTGLWSTITGDGGCTSEGAVSKMVIKLESSPIADAVVDAASGYSMRRTS